MMMTDDLNIHTHGRVGHISLNRPKAIHALTTEMCVAMADALGEWADHDGIAAVMIDHPYLPGPLQQMWLGMVTTDFAYVRLLGDRYGIEKITKSWGETVVNRDAGLSEWAALIHQVAEMADVQDLYSFSNNHYAGHAPATCRSLVKMVSGYDFPA